MRIFNFKRKNIIISIITVLILLIIFRLVFIPIIRFNINYNVPKGMTAEETLKCYFECLNNNNPAKANKLLIDPILKTYDYSIGSMSITSIEKSMVVDINLSNYYDSAEFFVKYDCKYFLKFEGMNNCSNFYLVKESENSNWKIHSWGLG